MIADADGHWTKKYIECLLLTHGYEVVLFPIWGYSGQYREFYEDNGVQVYQDTHVMPVVRHIPRLRMWARIRLNARALQKMGPFHIIHNHYLSQRDLAIGKAMRRRFPRAKWISSFWGSDLLRAAATQRKQMKPYLRRCDAITIHSLTQFELIQECFGKAIRKKTALVHFGQTTYDDIDRVRAVADRAACKAHFGIDHAHKVVCVGYNASPAQNQQQVLRALAALPEHVLQGMTVLLQMTYGASDKDYIQEVQQAAAALPCETLIYTEFMDGTESAYLRLAADVFILAIDTDAFSSSLREYLYTGAQTMIADWLTYPHLTELEIDTVPFSKYEQVPGLLTRLLDTPVSEEQMQRRAKLGELFRWEAVSEGWLELYRKGTAK